MKQKQRVSILLTDEEKSDRQVVVIGGFKIGFGRIMPLLLERNRLSEEEGNGRLYFSRAVHYIERTPNYYVRSDTELLIPRDKFYNVAKDLLREQTDNMKLYRKLIRDESFKRFNMKEWDNDIPLSGAIDILFNKSLRYLTGEDRDTYPDFENEILKP